MNSDSFRRRILELLKNFQDAHAEALGAFEKELGAEAEKLRSHLSGLRATSKAEQAKRAIHSRNNVLSAHRKVHDQAFALSTDNSGSSIRGATIIEPGSILVNARQAGVTGQLEVPLLVPLFGKANISIFGTGLSAESLINSIQFEALNRNATGDLRIISFDPMLTQKNAPFSSLSKISNDSVNTFHAEREVDRLLDDLTDQIARIGNLLQGKFTNLLEYRIETSKRTEKLSLVVFFDYPKNITQKQHERILTLAKAAPRHGIAFVFHVPVESDLPDWIDVEALKGVGEYFDVSNSRVRWGRKPELSCAIPEISPSQIVKAIEEKILEAEALTKVSLSSVLPEDEWGESSVNGLTVTIGVDSGNPVRLSLDDSVPHALITGSSGSGKSNLIKLLIHTLSACYSPNEVELYLLDMKEGATLAPLAPHTGSPASLPHARVLGLQADQEYGLSVLSEIERLYRSRMNEMSPYDNIKDYRTANPSKIMPRIVLIIDEFQLLLADDNRRIGRQATEKLLSLTKLVRAAGIHIIVATQEIGFKALVGIRDSLLSQIKLRIALKNTLRGSEMSLSSGNYAASDLKLRGEVVVNKEFGLPHANCIGRTPFADETELSALRTRWYDKRDKLRNASIIFDGRLPSSLLKEFSLLEKMRIDTASGSTPTVLLGRPVAVSQNPLAFTLDAMPGRNIAVVGTSGMNEKFDTSTHLALGIIQSIALSIAVQYPPTGCKIVIIDILSSMDRDQGSVDSWLSALAQLGHEPIIIAPRDVKAWIEATAKHVDERSEKDSPTFVFGLGFDRVTPLMEREGGVKSVAPIKLLQKIWQQGPVSGLHSFFWWSSAPSFLTHVEKKLETYFSGIFSLFGADEVAKRTGESASLIKWDGEENRALIRDYITSQGQRKIIPYSSLSSSEYASYVNRFTYE